MINFQKSSIRFSRNTKEDARKVVCDYFGVPETSDQGNYLGLPSIVGRNKSQVFQFIKDKVWSRIQGWKKKLLSKAGKEILLKTVAQAVPSYVMSVFVLPKKLCTEIERMMNAFWWSNNSSANDSIKWKAWDRLSVPKSKGGMGFRKFHEFNLALVAKQGWRLLTETNSLMARVYKARYFSASSLFDSKLGNNPSVIWRGIFMAKDLIKKFARRGIGDGKDTLVFKEPWLLDPINPYIESNPTPVTEKAVVASLKESNNVSWDLEMLNVLFTPRDKAEILKIPCSFNPSPDRWFWAAESNGNFTVKSAYKALRSVAFNLLGVPNFHWNFIWRLRIPPKVRNFIWRIFSECLPSLDVLFSRHVDVDPLCPRCGQAQESYIHIFVYCGLAQRTWSRSPLGQVSGFFNDMKEWWAHLVSNYSIDDVEMACMLLWGLWHSRNILVFEGKSLLEAQIMLMVSAVLSQWRSSQIQGGGGSAAVGQAGRVHG